MFTLEKKSYYYHYYYHYFLIILIYNFNIIGEIVLPYKQAYSSKQKLFLITFYIFIRKIEMRFPPNHKTLIPSLMKPYEGSVWGTDQNLNGYS